MTILLTGGTGKTGLPLAHLLSTKTPHVVLLASRKGTVPTQLSTTTGVTSSTDITHKEKVHGVTFDWFDPTSWVNPFTYVDTNNLPAIDRVYLCGPMAWDVTFMNEFADFARERGVKRFVLLSASQAGSGDVTTGQVHAHLEKLAANSPKGEMGFTILRPTWFTENFGETLLQMIREENTIYSICGDGKIPFVSVDDIAEAAFKALTNEPSPNTDWIIHGPDLYSYDESADILSSVLSRKITHVKVTKDDYIKFWDELGYGELGRGLAEAELKIAQGSEEEIFGKDGSVMGKVTLREYFEKNKGLWIKED